MSQSRPLPRIDRTRLRNGMILHARTRTTFGWLIRRVLKSWGSHDALLWHGPSGGWWVCDAMPPVARLTPLHEWEQRVLDGQAELRFYWPAGAKAMDGGVAAKWWVQRVTNSPYDRCAFPRLLLKALFMDVWERQAGKEWSWYCTEGVRGAWQYAGFDVWGKNNPTPGTTEKRVESGALEDWTGQVSG